MSETRRARGNAHPTGGGRRWGGFSAPLSVSEDPTAQMRKPGQGVLRLLALVEPRLEAGLWAWGQTLRFGVGPWDSSLLGWWWVVAESSGRSQTWEGTRMLRAK